MQCSFPHGCWLQTALSHTLIATKAAYFFQIFIRFHDIWVFFFFKNMNANGIKKHQNTNYDQQNTDLFSLWHRSCIADWCQHSSMFMSIFLLKSNGDTKQNKHFNVFILVICFNHCKNNIWSVKSLAFHTGSGTKDVVSQLRLSRLIYARSARSVSVFPVSTNSR